MKYNSFLDTRASSSMFHACRLCLKYLCKETFIQCIALRFLIESLFIKVLYYKQFKLLDFFYCLGIFIVKKKLSFVFYRTLPFCLVQNKFFLYQRMKRRKRISSLCMNPTKSKAWPQLSTDLSPLCFMQGS